jgi:ATP-dependent protease ClpP protease subunit
MSTLGGSVYYGLAGYNFLKGIPARVITHNFGSVDSIGITLYCAGTQRYSVPHARFLMHAVQAQFAQGTSLEEQQLEERLKGLQLDIRNIARVVSSNTGKTEKEATDAMLNRTTLDPDQAKTWGLVHEIKSELFSKGDEVISIQ